MRYSTLVLMLVLLFYSCRKNELLKVSSTEYFPNSVGNYWKYRFTDSISNTSYTIHVKIIGKKVLPSGQAATIWKYSFLNQTDTNYVYQAGDTIKVLDRRMLIDKTYLVPLQVNNKWKTSYYTFDSTRVAENRSFTLNNQDFANSFLLLEAGSLPNDYWSGSEWFCPGIGMITLHKRRIFTIASQATNEYWEIVEYSLK